MSENLYFIAILARALQEPDVESALKKAFGKIKQMGTQKRYTRGFRNFQLFMEAAYSRHELTVTDHIQELIARLATGTFEGLEQEITPLLEIIRSHREWQAQYEEICRGEASQDLRRGFVVIGLFNDKGLVGERTFEKVPGCESFDDVLPGNYIIKLANTGWVIWKGELTIGELVYTKALPLAAETEGIQIEHTSEKDLLNNGEVLLRTYAGTESGSIEIELRGRRTSG